MPSTGRGEPGLVTGATQHGSGAGIARHESVRAQDPGPPPSMDRGGPGPATAAATTQHGPGTGTAQHGPARSATRNQDCPSRAGAGRTASRPASVGRAGPGRRPQLPEDVVRLHAPVLVAQAYHSEAQWQRRHDSGCTHQDSQLRTFASGLLPRPQKQDGGLEARKQKLQRRQRRVSGLMAWARITCPGRLLTQVQIAGRQDEGHCSILRSEIT